MKSKPKVSVCIPSYNHAQYLPAAIDSILNQTFRDFEIVIVDDGSADGSLRIAQEYAAKYPSIIRVYTHPNHVNRGVSATVNLAFEKSQGIYWSGLPSDDILCPDKLARQVALLDAHPDIDWVYSDTQYVNEDGQALPGGCGGDITKSSNPLESLILTNQIAGSTVLARRECVARIDPHDETLVYSDWDFFIRLLAQCKVAFIPHPLVLFRVHSYNSSIGIEPRVNLDRNLAVMMALRDKAPVLGGALASPRIQAFIALQITHLCFGTGDLAAATQSLTAAFKLDPSLFQDTRYFVQWLQARRHAAWLLPVLQSRTTERDFGLWVLRQLPTLTGQPLSKQLLRQVEGSEFAHAARESYQAKKLTRTRQMALHCFRQDLRWLTNRELLSIFIESLVGPRIMGQLRSLKTGRSFLSRSKPQTIN